ncbi:MAG: hypothetical protein KF774_06790 [Planctomyces sp.]|nr:hypothetical protein [Planctomyces sp.]
MSLEPMEPFENAANFAEDVGMFEAATHSAPVALATPRLQSIVLALDGSDQDETAQGFAELIAARSGARVDTVSGATSAQGLLAELAARPHDLLVLPAPFGQDYRELGGDSLGSVVDQVLLKADCGVLCVRAPQDRVAIQAALDSAIVPIVAADEGASRAMGWAFLLTPEGGRIDLVAVADRDVVAAAREALPESPASTSLDPAQLNRGLIRDIGGLVAAAQKRGADENRTVHVETRVGRFVPLTLAELHGDPHLLVVGAAREHASPSFHHAVDLLLASSGSVLIV